MVLVVVDYLPAWVLGAYGNEEIKTPRIDLIARTGTRFLHHFAAAPAPEPGRASLLTGVDKTLGAAGYATATVDLAEAVKFLDQQTPGKPFLLIATDSRIRPPYGAVSPAYAQVKFETLNLERAAAPNAREGKEMLADIIGNMRKAASSITAVDEQIGAAYNKLSERKLLDNTLMVITGSCGALLGRHGLWGAAAASDPPNMFEEAVSTPMIWSWPGRVPAQATRPELIASYDLAPTLAELAGAEAASRGRSYVLLATGKPLPKKEPWATTVFARFENTGMARVQRYKIVLREKGANELYDLTADPVEKADQYDNPQFVTVREELSKSYAGWKKG
jgi:arylsulfatase A-like enzyme